MEILMKLKCTPSTPTHGSVTHSTLKVVDHHHQLAQQHTTQPPPVSPSLIRLPSLSVNYGQPGLPPTASAASIPNRCLEYATTMDCCNAAAAVVATGQEMLDMQWGQHRRGIFENMPQGPQSCCAIAGNGLFEKPSCCSGIIYGAQRPPPPHTSLNAPIAATIVTGIEALSDTNNTVDLNTHYEYQEPEENFVSIEDAKIEGFLLKFGQEAAKEKSETQPLKNSSSISNKNNNEENINEKAATKKLESIKTISKASNRETNIIYEIIELDDEDDREELRQIKRQVESAKQQDISSLSTVEKTVIQSPSISLIPKSPNRITTVSKPAHDVAKERIIAQIDLSDSSDSETEDQQIIAKKVSEKSTDNGSIIINNSSDDSIEDEELPLVAAALSCELECDEDDDDEDDGDEDEQFRTDKKDDGNSSNDIVILNSDEENIEMIDKHGGRLELRWDDLEEQKERNFFECYLCGKKVQSSYNLRRHMMIHTGERPFGCDMCVRRFREFSDLKKHRRRHVNDPNFVCMVCRINPPLTQDPTRCSACDSKTGAITAATRLQITSSEKSETSPSQPPPPLTAAPQRPASSNPLPASAHISSPAPKLTPANTISITIVTKNGNISSKLSKQLEPVVAPDSVPPETVTISQQQKHVDMPSLVPIKSSVSKATTAQMLLDTIPVVHRPSYNQLGIITRKEFPCPLCQRPFGTRHNLKRHFMIHTGEKPFSCSKCRKPFREYSTLKKHMVTHQKDRFYKCLRCPNMYRDYLEYNEHKKSHPTDEVNWDVGTSSGSSPKKKSKVSYSNDSSYDSNEDDSSAEDWLECCECKQRFTDIETYTDHLKEHDPGLFLYECYICKKTFEHRDELVAHMSSCKEKLRETALNRAKCIQ